MVRTRKFGFKGAYLGLLALFCVVILSVNNDKVYAAPTQPTLDTAREVNYTAASTAYVNDGNEFTTAYLNTSISRIVLNKDIDVSSKQTTINSVYLTRSLQIDGNNHTITATYLNYMNDYSFIAINSASNATLHFKNFTFISGGLNIIDGDTMSRSANWHIIIDNVDFPKDIPGRQAYRIMRMRNAHLFLRNNVTMYTSAENMYIGQITVEKNAVVVGEINVQNYSTWWFVDSGSNGTMNIGDGAKVTLNGVGGTSYPTIYEHFRSINIFKNATLIARKPGNALRFNHTLGVTDKYINVFEGATLDAASTGSGTSPIIDTLYAGSNHFYAAPKSNIFLIGSSYYDNVPLINLPNAGSSFELDQPARYDLRNNRKTGYVANVGSGANFTITNSDIEVWKKGSGVNLDIAPTNSWYLSNVVANNSGDPIAGSDPSMTGVWKTTNYARITGLNANPELKIRPITDAHKNFVVETYVLDDLAWANQVNINVSNDENAKTYTGKNNASGLFNFSDANFFKAGTKVTATGYRGVPAWSTLDPQANVIVQDVTPPTPAVTSSTLSANATTISGTSDEPNAKVTINLNGVLIKDTGGQTVETTVASDGTWTYTFPSNITLKLNDKLQILLKDTTGNQNPLVDTAKFDAIFKKGTIVNVVNSPKINAPAYVEVMQNSVYNPQTGVSATDSNSTNVPFGAGEFNLKATNNVDTSQLGIYTTTYTMKDTTNPSITTTATTKVLVKNADTVIDYVNDYMINASNYTLNQALDTITGSQDEVLDKSKVKSWSLSTGTLQTNVVTSTTYPNQIGGYLVDVAVSANNDVKKTISVSIIGANTIVSNGYAIDAANFFIAKNKVLGNADLINPTISKVKAWNTSNAALAATPGVQTNGGYTTSAIEGTYNAILNVTQSTATQLTFKATVIDKDKVTSSTNYAIATNDIVISRVDAQSILTNAHLISATATQSYKTTGITNTVNSTVLESDFLPVPGTYTVKFGVSDDLTTSVSSTIKVIDADHVASSKLHTIQANDFSINTTVADSINEAGILTRSLAKAYLKSDESSLKTVKITSNTITNTPGIYDVELYIVEEPTTKLTIKVNVTNGTAPVLTVPTPTEIAVNGSFNQATGVTSIDKEDGNITNDIEITGAYDTSKAGIYIISYKTVDLDFNEVIKKQVLVVNDGRFEVGTNYIIEAHNFVINKADVNTTDSNIVNDAQAKGYSVIDGSATTIKVVAKNGYTNEEGTYSIELALDQEVATTKSVKATVVDYSVIEKGTNYSIGANDIILGIEDVKNITNAKLLSLSQAQAWKTDNYTIKGTVDVEDKSAIQASVGTYDVVLNVNEETTTKATIKVKVVDKDKVAQDKTYGVGANNVTIGKLQAKAITTNQHLLDVTKAYGFKTSDYSQSEPIKIINSTYLPTIGVYDVTIGVVANESVRVNVKVTVIDKDLVTTGTNYLIAANNFKINTTVAATITESEIISNAAATSYLKDTMNISGTIKITSNTILAVEGDYNVEFYVVEEPATKVTIQVSVSNGNKPVLTVSSPVVINVGGTFNPMTGVSALGDDGNITNDITYEGTYDVNKAGIYVLTYTIIDSNYNTVIKKRVLVVNDGSFVIGANHILRANDFVINKKDVDTSNAAIIEHASAEAHLGVYDNETGEATEIGIKSKGGYTNTKGTYNIEFESVEDTNLTKIIKATVVDYDKLQTGSDYAIGANNIIIGKEIASYIASNEQELIRLSDAKAWKNNNFSNNQAVLVENINSIKAIAGTYNVTLKNQADPATKVTIQVTVLDYDVVTQYEGYVIGSNNISIGTIQAQTILTNQDIINVTNAKAFKDTDLNTSIPLEVSDSDFLASVGNYSVEFTVIENTNTVSYSKIRVLDADHANRGSLHTIIGNNFTINTTVAANITLEDIATKADVKAWSNLDSDISSNVKITSNTIKPIIGTYVIEFYVEDEPSTKIRVTVTVTNGLPPVLTVPTPTEINVNDSFDKTSGVSSVDDKDGNITADIEITGAYDVSQAGIYVLTYKSIDSDLNIVIKNRVLVVNDGRFVVGPNYIIEARDFVINKADVNTANAAVIGQGQAKGYSVVDGSEAIVKVNNLNGYSANIGTYSVEYAIDSEVTTTQTVKATVVDYSTITKGSEYSLGANNIVLGIEDVKNITNAKLLELSKAQAWLNTNYLTKGNVNVEDKTALQPAIGTYNVILNVNEETSTKTTMKVQVINKDKVVENDAYGIGANNVVIGKQKAQSILTNQDLINLTGASGWLKTDINQATPIKLLDASFNLSVGTHTLEFGVVADESVKVSIDVTVLDFDKVESGANYLIGANNFTINTTQATGISEAQIISRALATSYLKNTMATSGTIKITNNTIVANEGIYAIEFYVNEETNTKVTIQVIVSNGTPPVLNVTTPIVINVGGTFNPTADVSATGDEGNLTSSVTYTGTYDVNTVGVYTLTYSIKDANENIVTKKRVLVVNDGTYVVNDNYIIKASNFVINDHDVDTDSTIVKGLAKTQGYSSQDGSVQDVSIIDNGGYSSTIGTYDIKFVVDNDVDTNIIIKATVIDFDVTKIQTNYSIGANNIVIGLDTAKTITEAKLLNLTNADAWKANDFTNKATPKALDLSPIKAIAGTYNVTLSVLEDATTTLPVQVIVINKDVVNNVNDFVVGANNKIIGKKTALELQNDTDFIDLMEAQGFSEIDLINPLPLKIYSTDFLAAAGEYTINFGLANDANVNVDAKLKVIDKDYAGVGTNYVIGANDFTINTTEASTINATGILSESNAVSYIKSNLGIGGTVKVTANTITNTVGVYDIELYVEEEPTTKITIKVTVDNGLPPVLTVPTPTEIAVNGSFDQMTGVSSIDNEDGNITNDIIITGTYDTSKAGIYVISYKSVDLDFNEVIKKQVLVVNDGRFEVGTNYIIEAHNFVINKADVNTTDSNIVNDAQAKGYSVVDGSATTIKVVAKNGYTNVEGTYSIELALDQEVATSKIVKATVVDYSIIEKGTNYSIGANDIILGIEDVKNITNAKLLSLSKAQAWKIDNYTIKGAVDVEDKSELQASVGTYDVVLNVNEETATKATIKVKVVDKDKVAQDKTYGVGANNVTIGKLQATAITTDQHLLDLTKAYGFKTSDYSQSEPIKIINSTYLPAVGVYDLTIGVVANESVRVNVKVTVIDKDKVTTGTNYLIAANNFTINTTDAASITEAQIISNAAATSYLKDTMNVSGTIKITSNTILTTEGTYILEFYVVEEPATKVTIQVTVSNGNLPVLTVTSPVVINVGGTFNPTAGVSATGDEGDINGDITYEGTYDVNKAGIYVLTYTIIDSNYNTVIKKRVLVVNDGSFVIGAKHILRANDFVINKKDVDTSDAAIIEHAKAEAHLGVYDSETGESTQIGVKDKGGYTNTEGIFSIKFESIDDPDLTKTIIATVVDYDQMQTGSEYAIGANNIIIGKKTAKTLTANRLIFETEALAWKNNDFSARQTVLVEDFSPIKPIAGTYNVTLKIQEDPATKVTIQVTVLDYDNVGSGDPYIVLVSNDVVMGKVQAQSIQTGQDFIDVTQAKVFNKSDLNTSLPVTFDRSDLQATAGNYGALFYPTATTQYIFDSDLTVLDADHAKKGVLHTIQGNNFSINTTVAANITLEEIASKAGVKAWLNTDTNLSSNVKITSNTIKPIIGNYVIEFYVEDEPATKIRITVNVTNGLPPVLSVTSPIVININDSFDKTSGISSIDPEDKDITNGIVISGSYDTTKAGVYVLTYTSTDLDFNVVTKKRVLVVNDGRFDVGANYIVEAQDFIINKNDVVASDSAIITKAQAKAYKISDGSQSTVQVINDDNYQANVGTYDMLLAATNENASTNSIKATVVDYSSLNVGSEYSVGANNIVINKDQAKNISDTTLLELTKAEAWKNNDYANKATAKIEDKTALLATVGTYNVVINVDEETSTKTTIKVKVINADEVKSENGYVISANNFYLSLKDASTITDTKIISASAANSNLISDLFTTKFKSLNAKAITNVQVDSHNIVGALGVYDVVLSVVEQPSLKINIKATVLNYDEVINGLDYIIVANHITINTTQAKKISASQLITLSGAQAFKRVDNSQLVPVQLTSQNIKPIVNTYQAIFNVGLEPATKIGINVKVVKDTAKLQDPTINTVFENDTYLSGTAKANSKITITLPNGTKITTYADKNGKWKIKVPSNVKLKYKDVISIQASLDGLVSNKVSTTVKKKGDLSQTGSSQLLIVMMTLLSSGILWTTNRVFKKERV